MTRPAGKAFADDPAVLKAAVELMPMIRAAGAEIEQLRRLPPAIASALKDAGVFSMVLPRAWGCPELDPLMQIRVIEALAIADGSVGWCAMIGCDSGYVTAFLDEDVGRRMLPDVHVALAAAVSATGTATPVPGGYRVNGRFPFASGCQHSAWLWANCNVVEHGAPRHDGNGIPETRACFLPMTDCEVLDTWHTTGLRGTGSHDLVIHDVFVPAERTFCFQDPNLVRRSGPLYAFPLMFTAKGAAPALGVARRAIDALVDTAGRKPARRMKLGERMEPAKLRRDEIFVQESVARAEAMLGAARAYLFDVIGELWETLVAGEQPSPAQQARFITVYAHVVGTCVETVQLIYKASGGNAVYQHGELDRCLRDVVTMNQHVMGTLRTYEVAGRLLLGGEPLQIIF